MGRVYALKQAKRRLPKEGSQDEQELVARLFRSLGMVAGGYHDIIVCKAVAVFMGTLMTKTTIPGAVIGGFTKHIQAVTNMAIAHHKSLEKQNEQKVYGTRNPEAQAGQPGEGDAGAPQGSDRGVEEPEGQEVLLPPTLQ